MVQDESARLKQVVVCTPRKEYARGTSDLERHNIGGLSNPSIAIQQHNILKATLKEFGAEVIDIPELENHPNSVFTPRYCFKYATGIHKTQVRAGESTG